MVRWSPDTYFAQGTGHNSSKETKAGVGLQKIPSSIEASVTERPVPLPLGFVRLEQIRPWKHSGCGMLI